MLDETGGVARDDLALLVDAVLAGKGKSGADAETLPPAAYSSQAFFDLEVERIFKKDWFCVGHVSQVAETGDYFSLTLFGEPLVVVRGPDRIRVLSRVCLHRWAPVVAGEGNARIFSCPFHKWGYALDGQLLGAPFMEQAAGFDPKECRLPEIRSEIVESLGLIFITFSDEISPIAERLQDFSERYGNWRFADLVAVRPREEGDAQKDPWTQNHFNWKVQVETFMECYHHIGAHPETFEIDQPARLSSCEAGKPGWTVCHSPYRESAPESAYTFGLPVIPGIAEEQRQTCDYVLLYPATLLSIRPDSAGVLILIPVGPRLTLSRSFTLVSAEAAAQPALVAEAFAARKEFFDKANQEDIAVNEMQQAGAGSALARIGRLGHLERTVAHLAEYVRDRIAGNV
jgi:phenylpropionate dioxygenase-like ring-hydroxylating dioxygenase large terminal subunit